MRTVAVGLLLAGLGGGYFLSDIRQIQQKSIEAQRIAEFEQAEAEYLRHRHGAHLIATAGIRAAQYEASVKAAAAAKAEAARADAAKATATRKRREAQARYAGPIPESCSEYSGNRAIGCALLLERGFGLEEMPCLDRLWTKESGWNHRARNAASGAYGIPQALPGSKMATAGDDWEYNPATQIKWGLNYITSRYGTPCDAWAHSQSRGWY